MNTPLKSTPIVLTEPLKPCPFCGDICRITAGSDPVKVGCFNPNCLVKPKVASTCESTAIRRWNTRP